MDEITTKLTINGEERQITTRPNRTLLDVLREDFGLTGAKDGCGGEGECGACTVIMNDQAVNSCLVLIGQAEGSRIVTIEGLGKAEDPHPLQTSFVAHGAVQCGFCTPGAVLSAASLLQEHPSPSEEQIREALSGNLCRCTGYTKMITAVQAAAEEMTDD